MTTIIASTTLNTGYNVTSDTTGTLVFQTGSTPTTAMTITSGQNVGIGTSSPNRALSIYRSSSPVLQLIDATTGSTANDGLLIQQVGVDTYIENAEVGFMQFRTSATERMRIDSSGNLLVGKTSGVNKIETVGAGVDGSGNVLVNTSPTTIYTIKQSSTGAMCVIYGDDGSSGFMDLLFFLSGVTPQVVSSKTLYGAPAARTYTASSTALRCALASGSLNLRTAAFSTLAS